MQRILAVVLAAALFLAVPVVGKTVDPVILKSIRPLQWISIDFSTNNVRRGTHCTKAYINQRAHYWLTAAHCVADETGTAVNPIQFYVDGHEATVVFADFVADIAIMQTQSSYAAKALKLSKTAPAYQDLVMMAGYPYGLGHMVTAGQVAQPVFAVGQATYLLLDIRGCPGNSGSPIVNALGQIVSVLQVGFGSGCQALMGGAPFTSLVSVAAPWFGK